MIMVINLFFLLGLTFISVVIFLFNTKLRENDVKSEFLLQDEIRFRGEIIIKKTQEALALKKLSNQFSPQIIHTLHIRI